MCVVECDTEARPGYQTRRADEFLDSDETLRGKIAVLAQLVRRSQNLVLYTGAGISTASGVDDYATRAGSASLTKAGGGGAQPARRVSPLRARPTVAHRVLAALHRAGHCKQWIQQNHDGLPQKAGFPQADLNEIHGAWQDPTNPVVPMSGDLRDDLVQRLYARTKKADLTIALGTSLCGMNADRTVYTVARRHARGDPGILGAVIINLQRTQYDEMCQLRIYCTIDKALTMLAEELGIADDVRPDDPSFDETHPAGEVFEGLPYDRATGRRSSTKTVTLDLRDGARLRLVGQPDWDVSRAGSRAVSRGRDTDGHFKLGIPVREDERSIPTRAGSMVDSARARGRG